MAYERTWGFSANNLYSPSSLADTAKFTLWFIKAVLTGQIGGLTGTGLWTVEGSSDAVTGGMDGVDRWTSTYTPSLIVRAAAQGTAHSWIVIKSPVLSTGVTARILLDYVSSVDQTALCNHSRNAFTGGSNLNGPSGTGVGALTGTALTSATQICSASAGAGIIHKYNCILSTSGDFVLWHIRTGGTSLSRPELGMMVFGPTQTKAADQNPYWAWKGFADNGCGITGSTMLSTGSVCSVANYVGTVVGSAFVVPIAGNFGMDTVDNTLVDFPLYVNVGPTGTIGIRGRLPDLGVTPTQSSSISTGVGSVVRDAQNNIIYTTIGCLIVPFNTIMDVA